MLQTNNLPLITDQRNKDETCSQFVFGSDSVYVNIAYTDFIRANLYSLLPLGALFQEGDIVFYFDYSLLPTHVAKIDADGLVSSKFDKDKLVYQHELFGSPIPRASNFRSYKMYRKK